MRGIAIVVKRMRACGRSVCEGVVAYARSKGDWSLNIVDPQKKRSFMMPMIFSVDPDSFNIGWTAAETLDRLMRGEAVRREGEFLIGKPKEVVTRVSTMAYLFDPVWQFIRRNIARLVNASDVYAHAVKTRATVERTFKKVMESSLQHVILERRLKEFEHLLRMTGLAVNEVAKRSGFKLSPYFCHAFVATMGYTPRACRIKSDAYAHVKT